MQSKRDQVLAHSFVVARLRSAVLRGDADAIETPTRRFTVASIVGAVVAVLLVAGFYVVGLVFPGHSTAWRATGVLVLERESGTRYVLDGETLRPVRNLASASLFLGQPAELVSVSARSLAGVPRGAPVGDPDAPEFLPAPGELLTGSWLVCVTPVGGEAGGAPGTLVAVGAPASGASETADAAVLTRTEDGDRQLLWRDRRHRVADDSALVALGLASVEPVPVAPAWLAAIPEGPPLMPPEIPERGGPGPVLAGEPTRVGQVAVVTGPGGGREHYLVLAGGLAPIPQAEAAMILAAPESQLAYPDGPVEPVGATAAAVSAVPRATGPDWSALPDEPPEPHPGVADEEQVLCVAVPTTGADDAEPRVVLVEAGTLPERSREGAEEGDAAGGGGGGGADGGGVDGDGDGGGVDVVVPGGAGVLVRSADEPPDGGRAFVDELGIRYPIGSPEALRALGYGDAPPAVLPPAVLGLLPEGPALDVAEPVAGQP